jgi:phosphate transport system permease protein
VEKSKKSFTGVQRRRQTRLSVKITDKAAKGLITVGGIGTIIAVSTVGLFLIYVAVPLFVPASVEKSSQIDPVAEGTRPLHLSVDDYQTMGLAFYRDGKHASVPAGYGRGTGPSAGLRSRGVPVLVLLDPDV